MPLVSRDETYDGHLAHAFMAAPNEANGKAMFDEVLKFTIFFCRVVFFYRQALIPLMLLFVPCGPRNRGHLVLTGSSALSGHRPAIKSDTGTQWTNATATKVRAVDAAIFAEEQKTFAEFHTQSDLCRYWT